MDHAAQIIKKLKLKPMVEEGGFFVRTNDLGPVDEFKTPAADPIYFLISTRDFSALHRLRTDEVYHFYAGDPLELVQITPDGRLTKSILGQNVPRGHHPRALVAGGTWQGTRLVAGGQWALLGATLTAGFDPAEFELGSRARLKRKFPAHGALIERYTRTRGR